MKALGLLVGFAFIQLSLAESVEGLLKKAGTLDTKNENAAALVIYLEADRREPGNSEILRQISKQYAQQMGDEGADPKALGAAALDYALRAVKADPKNAQAHLGLAIVYGKIAFLKSAKERMEYSRE